MGRTSSKFTTSYEAKPNKLVHLLSKNHKVRNNNEMLESQEITTVSKGICKGNHRASHKPSSLKHNIMPTFATVSNGEILKKFWELHVNQNNINRRVQL